jgi:hypothetical protein
MRSILLVAVATVAVTGPAAAQVQYVQPRYLPPPQPVQIQPMPMIHTPPARLMPPAASQPSQFHRQYCYLGTNGAQYCREQ